jgi:hypothetical protein
MKHTMVYFLLVLFFTLPSCKKNDIPKDTPTCILNEIEKIKSELVRNPPASVWRYDYNGQIVFYIPPRCCDIPSQLLDSDCKQICSPDGGFSGLGDGRCTDFSKTKTNQTLIWQDNRTR